MDRTLSSNCLTSWKAAHGIEILENELENVDLPNICEEVQGRLAGAGGGRGGRRGSIGLSLGSAGMLLHGTALVMRQKANQTLQDALELMQRMTIKNYQKMPKYANFEDETEESEESEEDGLSEVERSSATSMSMSCDESADESSDSELAKTVSESGDCSGDMADVSRGDMSRNDNGRDRQTATGSKEDADIPTEQERPVHTCACLQARRPVFDPRLKLGLLLVYDQGQQIPSKIVMSSINPEAGL